MGAIQNVINRFSKSKGHVTPTSDTGSSHDETTKNATANEDSLSHEKSGNESYSHNGLPADEPLADAEVQPGELTFEEDTAGGMGRHLGLFSTTFLMSVKTSLSLSEWLKVVNLVQIDLNRVTSIFRPDMIFY